MITRTVTCPRCGTLAEVSILAHGKLCKACEHLRESEYSKRPDVILRRRERNRTARSDGRWRKRDNAGHKNRSPRYKEADRARGKLHSEIESGRLKRPKFCSRCGSDKSRIEAHHPDHSKPLEVIWLCPVCHAAEEKTLRESRRK